MTRHERSRTELYGSLAFAFVVLTCYAQFLFARRIEGEPWQVVACFGLGAVYVALFTFANEFTECGRPEGKPLYFTLLCALLTALVFISPVRGYFAILVLPAAAQAVFDLRWKGATAVGVYLFGISVAVFGYRYNARVMLEVAVSYLAGFAFTIGFTVLTVRAMRARMESDRLRGELETANAQLRAHAAEAEELATTRERNRLAREIHDGVGHYLTVIKVQLDAAGALLPSDPARAADSVHKAARLAGEALDDVRRSVRALATDRPRPPLVESLRALVADSHPPATLHVEGAPRPLSASAELALYRTAQEGLTNVRKHSAAARATLTLDFRDPARVRLTLADDGRGDTTGAHHHHHDGAGYGLRGLRERIALLGGNLSAGNAPAGGFTLRAEVPA